MTKYIFIAATALVMTLVLHVSIAQPIDMAMSPEDWFLYS